MKNKSYSYKESKLNSSKTSSSNFEYTKAFIFLFLSRITASTIEEYFAKKRAKQENIKKQRIKSFVY